jgi:hypothetical protein
LPTLQREREERAQSRPPVHLSQPMLAADGEDISSAVCGSLGVGISAGLR